MPYAVFVGFVCGIAFFGPCPLLACFSAFQSFVLISLMITIGMLVATSVVAGLRPLTWMPGCCCGAASMLVTAAALTYFFMKLSLQAAAAQAAALCGFGFHALHEASAARACKYILCEFGQRAAAASAAAFSCKNPETLLGQEKSEFLWFFSGLLVFLQWCLAGKSGMLEFVNNFSQFGKEKEKRFSLPKMSSKHDDLQASTPEDPGNLVIFKVWDGHSIDGSPSLGQGQATGRVDVPVGAIATSFDSVSAVCRPRKPGLSCREKGGNSFCEGGGRED